MTFLYYEHNGWSLWARPVTLGVSLDADGKPLNMNLFRARMTRAAVMLVSAWDSEGSC